MQVTVFWACENNIGRYQRFFNRFNTVWSGFKNLGNQTNRKRFFANTTRNNWNNSTNSTNLKGSIPIEHDHGFFKLIKSLHTYAFQWFIGSSACIVKRSMGKRSLCLIVLTPFCLVEEIRAKISCQKQRLGKNNIVFLSAGHIKKIEDVLPKNNKKKAVIKDL